MSGFEVAGVLLGVLPLVVEALKAGKKIKGSISKAEKANRILNKFCCELKLRNYELEETVLKVAKNAGVLSITEATLYSPETPQILRANERQLTTSLGQGKSETFLLLLEEARTLCSDLVVLLKDLFPEEIQVSLLEDSPCFLRDILRIHYSSSIWQHPKSRIKFLHRQTEIEKLLKELRRTIRQLERHSNTPADDALITGGAAECRPSAKQIKSNLASIDKIQLASTHLLRAVTKVIPGGCNSHPKHALRFFLEPHTAAARFCREQNPSFLIEILGRSSCSSPVIQHKDRIVVRQCKEELIAPIIESTKKRRQVTWAPIPTSLPTPSPTPSPPQPRPESIDTLCESLSRLGTSRLTIYVSEAGILQCQKGYTEASWTQKRRFTSLAEILKQVHQDKSLERRWSLPQRTTLAFILASNLLQLKGAEWAPDCLGANSIQFYVNDTPAFDTPPFDASQPFFENAYPQAPAKCTAPSFAKQWSLDLAILLLELWKGRSFESWTDKRQIRDAFQSHERRRSAAERWFDEMKPKMLPPYKDAAQRCLEFSGMATYRWDTKEFRERFFESVVGPLEHFTRGSREGGE